MYLKERRTTYYLYLNKFHGLAKVGSRPFKLNFNLLFSIPMI
jgi:hypothetical protein